MTDDTYVPFALPDIGEEEVAAAAEVLRSGWLTSGKRTAQFEREFCEYTGAPHSLAVNSCTAGLHLALVGLGVGPGAEVITTPLTFCATVNTILHVGAKPVMADIGPDLNIDPQRVARLITPRTRVIMPVHIAGLPCDMDPLWDLARAHKLHVVEDAAHASGSVYKGTPVGAGASDAVAFSFYANKNMTTGEGGMVTTPSEALYNQMRVLCLHGISRDAWNRYAKEGGGWRYDVTHCGFKYNLSDILSAVGIEQLRKLNVMNARRTEIARTYNAEFANHPVFELPPDRAGCGHAWHLYVLRLNLDHITIGRDQFFDELTSLGIGCSVHYTPIPLLSYYRGLLDMPDPCEHTIGVFPRLITLPIYSAMTGAQVQRVITAVHDVANRFRRRVPPHREKQ